MGEITTIGKASSNYTSLLTVVPMSIVKQWSLKEGDKLNWSWEARNSKMVVVRKSYRNEMKYQPFRRLLVCWSGDRRERPDFCSRGSKLVYSIKLLLGNVNAAYKLQLFCIMK